MNEKEELKQELQQQQQWVKYREKMLDIIEEKLLQMRQIAQQAQEGNLSSEELDILNTKLNNLAVQVRALDSESRRPEDRKILG